MVGVVFVFVSEDANEAEALADAFDSAGYSISGSNAFDDALSVILWSRAALRSWAFRSAVERALQSQRAVIASLIAPPDPARVLGAPVIDLSAWEGDDEEGLAPLFEAVREICPPQPSLQALAPFEYEDAEFTQVLSQEERVELARRAWEAPIPTEMLRPPRAARLREEAPVLEDILDLGEAPAPAKRARPRVSPPAPRRAPQKQEEQLIAVGMAHIAAEMALPTEPLAPPPTIPVADEEPKRKTGVAHPRRDYRRAAPPRKPVSHAPAALAFMFVVMVGVSAYTTRLYMPAEPVPFDLAHEETITLAAANASAAGLEDVAPQARTEPAPRRHVRARRAAASEAVVQQTAYVPEPVTSWDSEEPLNETWQAPVLIPASIMAELERATGAATDAAAAVTQPLAELSSGL